MNCRDFVATVENYKRPTQLIRILQDQVMKSGKALYLEVSLVAFIGKIDSRLNIESI